MNFLFQLFRSTSLFRHSDSCYIIKFKLTSLSKTSRGDINSCIFKFVPVLSTSWSPFSCCSWGSSFTPEQYFFSSFSIISLTLSNISYLFLHLSAWNLDSIFRFCFCESLSYCFIISSSKLDWMITFHSVI